jgi:hypothetical protein
MMYYKEISKKKQHRAQTTPDASFGPIPIVVALPAVYSINIIYETLVSIEKNTKNNKKTHLDASFGPIPVVVALLYVCRAKGFKK